jgi:hypothetical protein
MSSEVGTNEATFVFGRIRPPVAFRLGRAVGEYAHPTGSSSINRDEETGALMAGSSPPLIEVLIPTLNEAPNIAEAVKNASQLGPVFVLDACSSDNTAELAKTAGATVAAHPFVDEASQINWGLEHLGFAGQWVFILHADERIMPALRDEVLGKIGRGSDVGYWVNRQLIFMGRAIRHGGLFPAWNLRLFRRGSARFEQRGAEAHAVCDGPARQLQGELLQIRSQTITRYIEKQIHSADLECGEWANRRSSQSAGAAAGRLWIPLRPFWRFCWMYLIRLGFLDGSAGWHLACLAASHEYMLALLDEEKMHKRPITVQSHESKAVD